MKCFIIVTLKALKNIDCEAEFLPFHYTTGMGQQLVAELLAMGNAVAAVLILALPQFLVCPPEKALFRSV